MTKFRPMLAAEADPAKLRFPLIASPKLDGIRAIVRDGVVLSRTLKPIPNKFVQWLFGRPHYEGLDGELIVGSETAKDVYRTTHSAVMRSEGEPNARFFVFDIIPDIEAPAYETRLRQLRARATLEMSYGPSLVIHMAEQVSNRMGLDRFEQWALDQGYEGLILRDPMGPYKFGRSTVNEGYLLKLKRFQDSEARILGVEELMHNANEATTNALGRTERSSHKENQIPAGTMGALHVEDIHTGQRFYIGTGFSAQDRDDFWRWRQDCLGEIVKYKFFPVGVKDLPRHPSYLGLRDPMDL